MFVKLVKEVKVCDVCEAEIDSNHVCYSFAKGNIHIHDGCMSRIPLMYTPFDEEPDSFIDMVHTCGARVGLTFHHFIDGTEENKQLHQDPNYYVFVVKKSVRLVRGGVALPDLEKNTIVKMNDRRALLPLYTSLDVDDNIIGLLHKGQWLKAVFAVAVSLIDEDGNEIYDSRKER